MPAAYAVKACKLDQRYGGPAPEGHGPEVRKLASYGHVRGLVFGAFGEASEDVHDLVASIAKEQAARHWIEADARDQNDAAAIVARLHYRSWDMTAVRAEAGVKLGSLAHVGSAGGCFCLARASSRCLPAASCGGPAPPCSLAHSRLELLY